jgi:hypothetical protein
MGPSVLLYSALGDRLLGALPLCVHGLLHTDPIRPSRAQSFCESLFYSSLYS